MNITEDQARTVLDPYQSAIQECIVSAWKDYHHHCREIKHILTPRSRANIIFDFIVSNIRQKFQGMRNVFLSESRRLFLVNFENKVVIRFKKLKGNRASYIPTQQALDFMCQIELEEIPSPERFIIGYQLNRMQTEINNISVIYPQSANHNYWAYDLEPMEGKIFEYSQKQPTITPVEVVNKERIIIKSDAEVGKTKHEKKDK